MKIMSKLFFVLVLAFSSLPLFAQQYKCRVQPPSWNEETLSGYIQLRSEDIDILEHGIGKVMLDGQISTYRGAKVSDVVKLAMKTFEEDLKGRLVSRISLSDATSMRYTGVRALQELNPELEEYMDLLADERDGLSLADPSQLGSILLIYSSDKIPWTERRIAIQIVIGYGKHNCWFDETIDAPVVYGRPSVVISALGLSHSII